MYYIIKEGRRRRYIGFIITNHDKLKITKKETIDEFQRQCNDIFHKNYKKMGIRIIKFNGFAGIIRCNHSEKDITIKILKSIKKIELKNVKVKTIGTSGTIKSLEKKHMLKYF